MLGGLSVPRARCELAACACGAPRMVDEAETSCGQDVPLLQEEGARVVDETGADKTDAFMVGAQKAWEIARDAGCELAVFKAKSPSCGSGLVYDGTFSGVLVPGYGITAQLFRARGMRVVDEDELAQLVAAKRI